MPNDHRRQPTQPTQPKKGEPIQIPVPKISTIRSALRKVSKPVEPAQGASDAVGGSTDEQVE